MSKPESGSGTMSGYRPEYYDKERKEWRSVPLVQSINGIPMPLIFRGAFELSGCFGKDQALAFAHAYAAVCEGSSGQFPPRVRAVQYVIEYSFTAMRQEPEEDKQL